MYWQGLRVSGNLLSYPMTAPSFGADNPGIKWPATREYRVLRTFSCGILVPKTEYLPTCSSDCVTQHCRPGRWRVPFPTRGGRDIGLNCLEEESLTIVDNARAFCFLFCLAMDTSKVSFSLLRTSSLGLGLHPLLACFVPPC